MKDRIRKILDWTNMSQQDFATYLGISPASLSSIFTGRTNPTNNHVQAIHRAFPEINVNWLLFGEGEMMEPTSSKEQNGLEGTDAILPSEGGARTEKNAIGSIFSEEDFSSPSTSDSHNRSTNVPRRDLNPSNISGFQFSDNAKKIDIKQRKIKEIRVFFDDGTYESFVPSNGK